MKPAISYTGVQPLFYCKETEIILFKLQGVTRGVGKLSSWVYQKMLF